MRFLAGAQIKVEMRRLIRARAPLDIAIAYWGRGALKLLKLNPKRGNLRVICCLKDGKSAPDVIRKFGEKAKQNDILHAKVILAAQRAIVGSANASSNGLVEEENLARGLIEAGVLLEDKQEIKSVRNWFDNQWRQARAISRDDLRAAAAARANRLGRGEPAVELVDIPLPILKRAPLGLLLWSRETSKQEDRAVEKLRDPFLDATNIIWFLDELLSDARKYPCNQKKDYYALDIQLSENRAKVLEFSSWLYRFPPQRKFHRIATRSGSSCVVWAFCVRPQDVPGIPRFRIGLRSKNEIRTALRRRKMRLRTNIEGAPGEGFVSWEPLWQLLHGHGAK